MNSKIRLIVKSIDYTALAAGVDAPPEVGYRTFVVDAPEVVAFLIGRSHNETITRMVVGAEVVEGETR